MTKRHSRLDRGSGMPGNAGPEGRSAWSPRRLLVLVLTLAMVLAACGGDSGAEDEGDDETTTTTAASGETTTTAAGETTTTAAAAEPDERGTTLTYSYPQEPPNWNYWETGLTAVTAPLLENVWETLLRQQADGSVLPLLAESFEVSDDGLTVTFTLQQGVVFHDGSDFTAADVVYSLNKNKESGVSRASAPLAPVVSVEATDDYTVVVTLDAPSQSFIGGMAERAAIIVPENFFEENDAATTVVGTGPYTFGEYRIDQDVTLHRFDDYWGELPYFETVVQRFIPDETAALNALQGGELDFVASVIGEGMDRVATFEDDPNFTVTLVPGTEVSYWALNTNVEAFQDERVRQAIQHGHNRQSHIDAATAGTATPTCNMAVPAGVAWDTDYCPYEYDPERARELLEEAGATDLVLDFPFANVAWHTVMAQIFQAEMAEIGITVELRSLDLATWLDQVNTQEQYEIFQITSGASLLQYRCEGGRIPFGKEGAAFCDEEMDAMIDAVDQIIDRDEYVAAMIELHEYVADQGWIFATKKPNVPQISRADLVGFRDHRLPEPHVYVGDLRWDG